MRLTQAPWPRLFCGFFGDNTLRRGQLTIRFSDSSRIERLMATPMCA
jgi:hypothetical protein